jgi:hypothetical protein
VILDWFWDNARVIVTTLMVACIIAAILLAVTGNAHHCPSGYTFNPNGGTCDPSWSVGQ